MDPQPLSPSALQVVPSASALAAEWTEQREAFIRKNYCGDAPDPVVDAFLHICRRRGLAPEEKQIYLIKRGGKWVPQTSIDGQRLIAERTRVYAGSDEPVYTPSGAKLTNNKPYPEKASVTVWKLVEGVRCPFTASAHWEEFNTGEFLWQSHPHVMLAKCAESQALRKAFPADLGGLYTAEETSQDESPQPRSNPEPRAAVRDVKPEQPKPLKPPAAGSRYAMQALHATAHDKGITHEQLHDLAVAAYGVPSLTECDPGQLKGLRDVIVAANDYDAIIDTIAIAMAIDDLDDVETVDSFVTEIHDDMGTPDRVKDFLFYVCGRVRSRIRNRQSEIVDVASGEIHAQTAPSVAGRAAPSAKGDDTPGDAITRPPRVAPHNAQDAPSQERPHTQGDDTLSEVAARPGPVQTASDDPDDDERALFAWRDQIDAAYTETHPQRRATAIAALFNAAGDDWRWWVPLMQRAPSLTVLNQAHDAAGKNPAIRPHYGVVSAYNERHEHLTKSATQANPSRRRAS